MRFTEFYLETHFSSSGLHSRQQPREDPLRQRRQHSVDAAARLQGAQRHVSAAVSKVVLCEIDFLVGLLLGRRRCVIQFQQKPIQRKGRSNNPGKIECV
jgi:hypothetical protein